MPELPEIFDPGGPVPAPHPAVKNEDGTGHGPSSVISNMLGQGKGPGRKKPPGMPGQQPPMTPFANPGQGFAHLLGGGALGSMQMKGYLGALRQGANPDSNVWTF